jgi:hypothetical protein
MPWFKFESKTLSWRIVFACLVVCSLQVQHASSDEDHGRSGRPGVEDWGWSSIGRVLGGRAIGRSDDAMCDLHVAQGGKERGFLG